MTPEALLDNLKRMKVALSVEDGVLQYRPPAGVKVTPYLQALIADNRAALTALVEWLPLTDIVDPPPAGNVAATEAPSTDRALFSDPRSPALWAQAEALGNQSDEAGRRGDQVEEKVLSLRFRAAYLELALLEGWPCFNAQGEDEGAEGWRAWAAEP